MVDRSLSETGRVMTSKLSSSGRLSSPSDILRTLDPVDVIT